MKDRRLTGREVLARMRSGDFPTYGGGYTAGGHFDDGAKAGFGVMYRLHKAGKVDYPPKTSVTSRYTLREDVS